MGSYPFVTQGTNIAPAFVLPSGDTTGVADTANIGVALTKGYTLGPGTFYVKNLTPDSTQVLAGVGRGTILQAVAGTTGYVVALKTPASTYQVTVQHLTIIPNTGSLGGVQLDNTGFTSGGGETDSMHTLEDVYVKNAGGDGFHLDNNIRSLRMTRCASYGSGGDGIYVGVGCSDSSFTGCISGTATLYPWHFLGWNNFVSSCKGFYGGWNGSAFDTSHSAWLVGTNASYNTFASCSAQNGALHGWDLQACKNCTFTGCEADNNSSGPATTGAGFNTNGILNCTIAGCTGDTGQAYGLQVAGTQTGTSFVGNTVTGSAGPFNYVSGGGYFLVSSTTADFSGGTTFKTPLITMTSGSTTAPSAPILTALGATSGSAIQLSDTTRDYMVYLEVTTAGTATSVTMGHTSAANDVTILSSVAVAAGDLFSFRLPAGWWFKWTGTTTAIGNQNAVGC